MPLVGGPVYHPAIMGIRIDLSHYNLTGFCRDLRGGDWTITTPQIIPQIASSKSNLTTHHKGEEQIASIGPESGRGC